MICILCIIQRDVGLFELREHDELDGFRTRLAGMEEDRLFHRPGLFLTIGLPLPDVSWFRVKAVAQDTISCYGFIIYFNPLPVTFHSTFLMFLGLKTESSRTLNID